MSSQLDQQRVSLELDLRKSLSAYEDDQIKKKLAKERERIRAELDEKLEREREKELRKFKVERQKLEDRKDDLAKEFAAKLKDEKRKLEK